MLLSWLRNRRRRKLLARPFPHWWVPILERNVGHYPRLSPEEQAALRDITRVLVAEKNWEGCGGLFVTEEIRVTVAAQAALLLLGSPHDYYSRVDSVVVYPRSFRTPVAEDDWEDDEMSDTVLSGQAVYRGPVILSWEEVLTEGRDPDLGFNVVVHEFAHQLDYLDNLVNGTPDLGDPDLSAKWRYVMTVAFEDHRRALKRDEETFFTEHAAENETEFFADASEAFFCRPADLREETPGVYELLAAYYRVDPIRWFPDDPTDPTE
jgi:Mlc titration factor MtfA (ptsG expression regulator)